MEATDLELTQAYVKSLFYYRDGISYWKYQKTNRIKAGEIAGCIVKYATCSRRVISIDKKHYMAARLIFLYHKGWMPAIVDHRDINSLNDKIDNLRAACKGQNNANRLSKKQSSSKFLGVSWDKKRKKWEVHLQKHGKNMFGGRFISEEEAALAYNKMATIYHGEFANLNIIT